MPKLNELLLLEPPIISYKPETSTKVTVNIQPAQHGCHGNISYIVTAEECIQDDNCEGIQNKCDLRTLRSGQLEKPTLNLGNLPPDPHKYIISATGRNDVGQSMSTATYIFGAQLGNVTEPEELLLVAPEATSIKVTFKPPCPFAGNLTYDITVKGNINNL